MIQLFVVESWKAESCSTGDVITARGGKGRCVDDDSVRDELHFETPRLFIAV